MQVLPMVISDYKAPLFFRNGHVQSIYPTLFRKIKDVVYHRKRIETPDQDFLDLDWSVIGSDSLAIISHGLEGNSQRAYVKGMVRAMNQKGIDALAWNFAGAAVNLIDAFAYTITAPSMIFIRLSAMPQRLIKRFFSSDSVWAAI